MHKQREDKYAHTRQKWEKQKIGPARQKAYAKISQAAKSLAHTRTKE